MKSERIEPILIQPRPRRGAAASAAPAPPTRPTPRPRDARRQAHALRIAVSIVVFSVCGVMVARAAGIVARPVISIYRSGREIERLRARLAEQEERRRRLTVDMAYLKTPAGVEEEARRQGWVKHGETAIQLVRPEAAPPSTGDDGSGPNAKQEPQGGFAGFIQRCLTCLRGRQ